MPRARHPISAVLTFFRTQPESVCKLTLQVVQDEVKMRFQGLQVPKAPTTRKPRTPRQRELPLSSAD